MRKTFQAFSSATLLVSSLLILNGCSKKEKPYEDQSVAELYNGAMNKLQQGEFSESAKLFDEVTRQHPYSKWAQKAQVMEAYAQYRGQKYDNVIASLEAYIGLHPANEDVPYALYMIGLSHYEQISPSTRDQQDTVDAIHAFNDLISRFPNTPYAKDARERVIFLTDVLAGKSMEIGRFYQSKEAFPSAIVRFQEVVQRFQKTRHVEEALHRIVECYLAMGMRDSAVNAAAVLGHNYPGGKWYAASYDLLQGDQEAKLSNARPTPEVADTPSGESDTPDIEESTWDKLKNWYKGKKKKTEKLDSIETQALQENDLSTPQYAS